MNRRGFSAATRSKTHGSKNAGRNACAPRRTAPKLADMASNEYHFISEWQVEGTVQEASAIINDTASLPR